MKIYSWNVNGIRAVLRKDALKPFIEANDPDILCIQETKAQVGEAVVDLPDYQEYWYSAVKKGYSGTAVFSKTKPLAVTMGFPADIVTKFGLAADGYGDPNQEGRVLTAEYDQFYLVTVYTPNAKDDLSRVPLRHKHWDPAFLAYTKGLEEGKYHLVSEDHSLDEVPGAAEQRTAAVQNGTAQGAAEAATPQFAKPVVFCGDLNVAHTPDDLARPKPNEGKKGYTPEERAGFQAFVDAGFIDTFRLFHEGNGFYTWWSNFGGARERNIGWRIDYFLVSAALKDKVTAAEIYPAVMGSDHCPISITLNL